MYGNNNYSDGVRTRRTSLEDPNYYSEYFPRAKRTMPQYEPNLNGNTENVNPDAPVTRRRHMNLNFKENDVNDNNSPNRYSHRNNYYGNHVNNYESEPRLNGKIETRYKGNPPKRHTDIDFLESDSNFTATTNQKPKINSKQAHTDEMANQTLAHNDQTDVQILPVKIDSSVTFSSVGGLTDQLNAIKEIAILPLLYPDLFSKFSVSSAKGIIFHGPPGTGKTLMARAIASECDRFAQQVGKKVSFYVRKGADLLSKWVGETEKNLKSLFDVAKESKPSIIFFDEIDGLAPSRNASQDHVHNSTVATFLALLDGLESRGDIIVIGATNRIDSLDVALRRPGRFDRELYFPLPNEAGRKHILRIHTDKWAPKLTEKMLTLLSKNTENFSGADIKGVCNQAVLNSIRRSYPQIYESSKRLKINPDNIYPNYCDFLAAIKTVTPFYRQTNDEGLSLHSNTVKNPILHLIETQLLQFEEFLKQHYLFVDFQGQVDLNALTHAENRDSEFDPSVINPFYKNAYLIFGCSDIGFLHYFMPESIRRMKETSESFIHLDLQLFICQENPIKKLFTEFGKIPSNKKRILFISNFDSFWKFFDGEVIQTIFIQQISMMHAEENCLIVFCFPNDKNADMLNFPLELSNVLRTKSFQFDSPDEFQISKYVNEILSNKIFIEHKKNILDECSMRMPELPEDDEATKIIASVDIEQVNKMRDKNLRQLRILLRLILKEIMKNKNFSIFTKPVDPEEVMDYYRIIKNPMCFEDIIKKIDSRLYNSFSQFRSDIEQIVANALEYNPPSGEDLLIRHRAFDLRDTLLELMEHFVESRFVEELEASLKSYNSLNDQQPQSQPLANNHYDLNGQKSDKKAKTSMCVLSEEELENTTVSIDIQKIGMIINDQENEKLFSEQQITDIKQIILAKPSLKCIESLVELNAIISREILRSSEVNLSKQDLTNSIIKIVNNL